MAFELIDRSPGIGRARLSNTVSVNRFAKGNAVRFTFSRDVYSKLGSPEALAAYRGTGIDTGTILFVPARKGAGYTVGKNGGNLVKVDIGVSHMGSFPVMTTTRASFDVTDRGIVVTLPQFAASEPEQRQSVNDRPARVIESTYSIHA